MRSIGKTARRALVRVGAVLLAILVVAVILVTFLVTTNAGLRVGVDLGLRFYNGRIPGEITVDDVEGRLLDGFTLRGVMLRDRQGRALITADAVAVDWSVWPLLRGNVIVQELLLERPHVYLTDHEGEPSDFADLAPISAPAPDDPHALPGPDLPIGLDIYLVVRDAAVLRGGEAPIVTGGDIDARVQAAGRVAAVEIHGARARVFDRLEIAGLRLGARWSAPVAEIVDLRARTDGAEVTIPAARLDVLDLRGDLEVRAAAMVGALAPYLSRETVAKLSGLGSRVDLSLVARNDPAAARGELRVGMGPGLSLTLTGAGDWGERPTFDLALASAVDLTTLTDGAVGRVSPGLELRARVPGDRPLPSPSAAPAPTPEFALTGALRCPDCEFVGGFSGELTGAVDPARGGLSLQTDLRAAGLAAAVDLRAVGKALRDVELALAIPDLARPAALARAFAPKIPAVEGSLSARAVCSGPDLRCGGVVELGRVAVTPEPQPGAKPQTFAAGSLRLDLYAHKDMLSGTAAVAFRDLQVAGQTIAGGDLTVHAGALASGARGHPPLPALAGLPPLRAELRAAAWRSARAVGDRALLDVGVVSDEALSVDLRQLDARYDRFAVALMGPARAALRDRSVRVDDLRLDLGRGRLRLDGRVDLDGASDARLEIDALSLAMLRPFVRDLRPAGTLGAVVRLRGPSSAPEVHADVAVRGAAVRGSKLGDLDLDLDLKDGRAGAQLAVAGPLARRLDLNAGLPVAVDLSESTWSLAPGRADVDLRVAALRLDRLGKWIPKARLAGRLDGYLRVAPGQDPTLEGPRIASEWHGEKLAVAGVPIGDLDVDLYHRGEWLRGTVDVHRGDARVKLDAQVPLIVDLGRGRFAWERARDHRALLTVTGLDLARQLEAIAPQHDVAGKIGLRVDVTGPASAPEVDAELKMSRVVYKRVSFGSGTLKAFMRRGATELELAGGGGHVGRYQIHALAPFSAGVDGVRWRPEAWHAADVEVREVDLSALQELAGVVASGRLNARLSASGDAHAPRITAKVATRGVTYQGEDVGWLDVDAALVDHELRVTGSGHFGRRTRLRADGRVPLALDLADGKLEWRPTGPTRVEFDLVDIDRSALTPLSTIPREALIDLDLHARALVDAKSARAQASLSGAIGSKALGGTPVALNFDIFDDKQRVKFLLGSHGRKNRLRLIAEAAAKIPALRRGEGDIKAAPLKGELLADEVDLRYLGSLLPPQVFDAIGFLDADFDIGGVLGKPDVHGSAYLRHGGVTVVPLQQRLRDIDARIDADGPKIKLEHLTATSGEGTLRASGDVEFVAKGELRSAADLRLRKFPIVRPGLPQMIVDTRVQARVEQGPDKLGVAVTVGGTEVWVTDLTTRAPKPIPVNERVTIVTGPLPELQAALGSQPAAVSSEAEAVHKGEAAAQVDVTRGPEQRNLDLSVVIKEPVHIQGPTMDMRWGGKIAVRQRGEKPEVTGAITSDRGRFELLGSAFRIDRGRVFLPKDSGEIDPYIDIVAVTNKEVESSGSDDIEVTATIRGRVSRPELKLSSDRGLTEAQIFSLLVTGTVDSNESDPGKTQASAVGLLANFSNPTISRFADQKLGIDRVKLGFASDGKDPQETARLQPVLTIGKYVTKKIYAETTYHHNAPARQNRIEGRVEYMFRPSWSLESSYGDAAVGGVDLFWRRSFGRGGALSRADTPSASQSNAASPKP